MPISKFKESVLNLSVLLIAGLLIYAAFKTGHLSKYTGLLLGIITLVYYYTTSWLLEKIDGKGYTRLKQVALDLSIPALGILIIIAAVKFDNFNILLLIFIGLPLYYFKAERYISDPKDDEILPEWMPDTLTCSDCGLTYTDPSLFEYSWEWKDILVLTCHSCAQKKGLESSADWIKYSSFGVLVGLLLILTGTLNALGWFLIWVGAVSFLRLPLSVLLIFAQVTVGKFLGARLVSLAFGTGKRLFGFKAGGGEVVFNNVPCGAVLHAAFNSDDKLKDKLFLLYLSGPLIHLALIIGLVLALPSSMKAFPFSGSGIYIPSTLLSVCLINLYMSVKPFWSVLNSRRVESEWSRILPIPFAISRRARTLVAGRFSPSGVVRLLTGSPR